MKTVTYQLAFATRLLRVSALVAAGFSHLCASNTLAAEADPTPHRDALQQASPPAAADPSAATPGATANLPMVEVVAPGRYRMGDITIDKAKESISFPTLLNMDDGIIEYVIVQQDGKTHESLLKTAVAPAQIHLAMLLLGSQTAKTDSTKPTTAPPTMIDANYLADAPEMHGDSIEIVLHWQIDGQPFTVAAEKLIGLRGSKQPLDEAAWVYNGSEFQDGRFLAESYDVIGATITDPAALFNRAGRHGAVDYIVHTADAPPIDTPVTVTLRKTKTRASAATTQTPTTAQ